MSNFKIINLNEFKELFANICEHKKYTQIHIHHTETWRHQDYDGTNGIQLQEEMYDLHVNKNGWIDIGQHITVLPDGLCITGRDWNINPSSIRGWNEGAFAIEILGNFDIDNDIFTGKQANTVYEIVKYILKSSNLSIDAVKFHNENPDTTKTCPGTSMNKKDFINNL